MSQSHSSTKRKRRPKNSKRKDPTQATMASLRQLAAKEHAAKEKDKKAAS